RVDDLAQRIRALPGAERLLPALDGLAPAWLVGGAVRDLLLGARSVDLDVAIEGDAGDVARRLAERLGGEAKEHERFGTATVRAGDLTVDLATARRERYAAPGALPEVEPAAIDEDLARRDFTINAMAASLDEARPGELLDPHGGRGDLESGAISILHPQSFVDDPTRLLRAVRYEARFGFSMDEATATRAEEAIAAGAPSTVSGARIRDELLDLLDENAVRGASRMRDLGLDAALAPALGDAPVVTVGDAAQAAPRVGAQPKFAALAAYLLPDPNGLVDWVEDLHLRREDRDAVLHAARKGPQLAQTLSADLPDSALHALLHCELPEVFAVAIAAGAPEAAIQRYLTQLGPVRLEITGDDLRAAGIPESPAIGRALEHTLKLKLDGEVSGHDDELAAALELARRGE
ncbi:MAG: CCA tRNA nucleotidyltransferase, partial [Thermoleophilaceae bacterium]